MTGSWAIVAEDEEAYRALVVSDGDRAFNRLRDARSLLARSTYDWLGKRAGEIDAEYDRLMKQPAATRDRRG